MDKPQEQMTSADYYADSYSHFGIHEEMLKDSVRTKTYMRAILNNEHLFKDKAVLDVGCGTGILSMFAAKAGARTVFAVDMSAIAKQAKEIVAANGFEDVIHVFHGKMEDIDLPEKVDVIISEWMGYALYYESMLPTILAARDRWLRPGGAILPDRARILVAAIEDQDYKEEKIEFWTDVYGFDMSVLKHIAIQEPLVDVVDEKQLTSSAACLVDVDINTMTAEDIPFDTRFSLVAQQDDYVHALVIWFDVEFGAGHKPLRFSTSPAAQPTHWKQTVLYLKDSLAIRAGEVFEGRLKCTPNQLNPRDLDFQLTYQFAGARMGSEDALQYRMR